MKTYTCQCGARLHFENSLCVSCQHELGFLPDARMLSTLKPLDDGRWMAFVNDKVYRKCKNYYQHHVCNWMVPETDNHAFCFSCRLSKIIPDLSNAKNLELWGRIERAKRRLLYSLLWLELPIIGRDKDKIHGLAFHLMEDQGYSEFVQFMPMQERVVTGHKSGVITLNIAEADPVSREQSRTQMQEAYRTLLGHFRHESGHYYWDLLLRGSPRIEDFRGLFGDERKQYDANLKAYYANGPAKGWETRWISAYASAHPWEDWAETWAHYLHMIDTLETACDYGFDVCSAGENSTSHPQFSLNYLATISIYDLVEEWSQLSVTLNDLNRSMGLADAYPFVLSNIIIEKLAFVHDTVINRA
jgi:hypothetical protein